MAATAAYFWLHRPAAPPAPIAVQHDLPPGGNKATLTLSNGTQILLDSARTGQLASEGNSTVEKADSGRLVYNQSGNNAATLQYNTLRTPRGGQYQLTLPDGSRVWLNAASAVRFPASFPRHERVVEVTGEAYFEVARDAGAPFSVRILSSGGHPKGAVQVLGTRFNINAYDDEPFTSATLLEGAVAINSQQHKALLKPGEQAQLDNAAGIRIAAVDTEEAVAWKNGEFIFNNANITDIMRQLSRWYNVEVSYKDALNVVVNGSISRNVNIFQVLHILEQTGEVHFKVNGNRIEVTR
jgi:ferric-dicitrate binding protein FerR (iron transport regulator)